MTVEIEEIGDSGIVLSNKFVLSFAELAKILRDLSSEKQVVWPGRDVPYIDVTMAKAAQLLDIAHRQ